MTANRRGSTPSRTSVVRGPNAKPGEGWIPREAHRTTGGPTQEDILQYLHRGDPVSDGVGATAAADLDVQNAGVSESQPVTEADRTMSGLVYDLDALSPTVTESVGVEVTRVTEPLRRTTSVEATAKVKHTWTERVRHPGPPRAIPAWSIPEPPKPEITKKQEGKQETPEQSLQRKLDALPPKMVPSTRKTVLPAIGAVVCMILTLLLAKLLSEVNWLAVVMVLLAGCATTAYLIGVARNAPLEEVPNPSREWLIRQHESNPRYWS